MNKITIRDIAKKAGVGVGTVSRVLNGHEAVSDATRRKVLEAIQALDYRPNRSARQLSLGKTFAVGVIAPFFTIPSVVERLRGIEHILAESGYDMILLNVETIERRNHYFQEVPRRERVDGILLMSLPLNDGEVASFARVPTVMIDSQHPLFSNVGIDDLAGAYQATKHLIDLGHTKIAYIGDPLDNPFHFPPIKLRLQGYHQAMQEAQLPTQEVYCRFRQNRYGEGARLAQELLAGPNPPTAIFAFSDMQAIGAVHATKALNLRVPEDVSIIGFDDIEVAQHVGLTTIKQPLFDSGVKGCQLLMATIGNKKGDNEVEQHVFPTELVVRHTTGHAST